MAFDSDYEAVLAVKARRDRLDTAIEAMAADSEFTPVVSRLGCLRGVGTLTMFSLAVESGDWQRFTGASIGSFSPPRTTAPVLPKRAGAVAFARPDGLAGVRG